jgi:hypothetical protein
MRISGIEEKTDGGSLFIFYHVNKGLKITFPATASSITSY